MYIMKNSIKRAQKELVHSAERENFCPWGKRIFAMAAVAMMTVVSAQAQELETDDLGIFNHASLSVGVGTTGITADLALPITPYVAVRGGADICPFKYSTDLKIQYRNAVAQAALPETVAVTGKLAMTSGHLLFDFFPSNQSSFHITAGAYLGSDKVAEVYNKEDGALAAVTAYNRVVPNSQKAGYTLGDYFLTPDENGNVNGSVTVAKFRPYVGIGFGRPVPTKNRVACNFDLGVQFWGKPDVVCQGQKLEEEHLDGDDGGIVRTVSKLSVWPVLNLRLAVRLF